MSQSLTATHRCTAFTVRSSACSAILFVILHGVIATGETAAQDANAFFAALEQSVTKIIEGSESSIVAVTRVPLRDERIERERARNPFGIRNPFERDDNPLSPGFVPREYGTGIIVASVDDPGRRFVLTNLHVVRGGQPDRNDGTVKSDSRIFIRISQNQATQATIYAADPRSDLAVLSFDEAELGVSPADLPAIPMTDQAEIRKGQFVISLGNPYAIARDGSPSVSIGMVSNISRFPFADIEPENRTIHHFGTLLHVDTRLGPGTSGGALLNGSGELVGITTSLAALEGYETTVGYAIPINAATRRIVNDLLKGYEVEYGFLGVRADRPARMKRWGNSGLRTVGLLISQVVPNSPAHLARLKVDEIILQINGKPIFHRDDLFREVGLQAPGSNVVLRVRSDSGRERIVSVQLAKWPVPKPEQIITSNDRYEKWRGIHVDWATSRQQTFDAQGPFPKGVLVVSVEGGSPADRAGLRNADDTNWIEFVNDKAVETPDDFLQAVKRADSTAVRLRLAGGRTVTIPN